ncbi:MAG: ribonuclease P protein component [Clostridiales bacterium]|nr:ribonuclease P protein component [Clostridiales bacterium]
MLNKANRLNKHGSFAYVYRKGNRLSESDVVLIYTAPAHSVRVGFSVSNKVGKAVVRNKVKRRLRSAVQNRIPSMRGCQAIVLAKPSAADKSFEVLSNEVEHLLYKAGLLK